MKSQIKLTSLAKLTMGLVLASAVNAMAQGNLTPPGPPAPTMKSLDQIEPRTPVYAGSAINNPGSYYLTTNAVGIAGANGISIYSDNVTLDLNGFTLQGIPGSFSGINVIGSHTNITIRNGIVTGWGGNGIGFNYPTATPQNMVVQRLTVTGNLNHGIVVGNSSIVSDCTVQNNNWLGIFADGDNSRIVHNSLTGNNAASHSGTSGIEVRGNNNLVEDNFVSGTTGNTGIVIFSGTSNLVIKNAVIGWGTANDYSIPTFNDGGPIGTAASSTSPWANIAH